MSDARIRIVTIAGAVAILFLVLELVRRRKLKEEYSVLWVVTAFVLLLLSVWYGLLDRITRLIGAAVPASTLFFFGLVFVIALLLHFSVRISSIERRMTALIQEIGIMTVDAPRTPPPAELAPGDDAGELADADERPEPAPARYER
jgi:hypothetical protein